MARSSTGCHWSRRPRATAATSSGRPTTAVPSSTVDHGRRTHQHGSGATSRCLLGCRHEGQSVDVASPFSWTPPSRQAGPAVTPVGPPERSPPDSFSPSWSSWPTTRRARDRGRRTPRHRRLDDPTAFVLGGAGGLRRRSAGALGTWLGLALVGVLVAIPLRGLYRFTGGTMEEGFMLYFPERIAQGDVPNVDFLHLYGPGSLAGAHRLVRAVRALAAPPSGRSACSSTSGSSSGCSRWPGRGAALAATAVAALAVFYVLTPDRADGDGLERRPRPDAVERGVRRPRRPPRRPDAPAAGVARSPGCSPGSP